MTYRIFRSVFALVGACILVGCGGGDPNAGPVGTVSGTVTIGGKVLPVGQVTFNTEDNKRSGLGEIKQDGSYTVTNAPVGKTKVVVIAPPPPAPGAPKSPMATAGPVAPVAVPMRYQSASSTDLVYEVKTGSQTFDIKLKEK